MLVATKIKADWNRAADPPVVGPVWVGMVLVEMTCLHFWCDRSPSKCHIYGNNAWTDCPLQGWKL